MVILSLVFFSAGCVDLYYARDFSFREFLQDHVKDPVQSVSDHIENQIPEQKDAAISTSSIPVG